MQLRVIDLTDYLETRCRMRLLPNLMDFGIAYTIFRPVVNLYQSVKPLAQFAGQPVGVWLYSHLVNEPFRFFVMTFVYALYTIANATISGVIGVKVKTLVLSDSPITISILGVLSSLIAFAWLFMLPGGAKFIVPLMPAIYMYASGRYLLCLNKLEKHSVYQHLVGVPRRTFAYSTARYAFFSRESMMVYGYALRAAWRLYLGYFGIGLLSLAIIIAVQGGVLPGPEEWFHSLTGWQQIVVIGLEFFILVWLIKYLSKLVANEWRRWTRELRSELARSASALSWVDGRPPILFLRSFRDEHILVTNERFWGHRLLGVQDDLVRLEEVLAETLYAYGPLVALSNPDDELPQLGAARDNIDNKDWQSVVDKHMSQASKILLLEGSTPSLKWEVEQMALRGLLSKALLVFPPEYRSSVDSARLLRHCLPSLSRESFY